MQHDNAFRQFWGAGYRRLIPITPPGCPVSERSSLYKRPKDIGKAPGVRGDDGLWRGVNWMKLETTEALLDSWHAMGAGVGIRTGAGLICVDIDTLDQALGDICGKLATQHLGQTPNRVGRSPKRAKLYRIIDELPYRRLSFEGGHVELLTEGKQFVAHGIHPVTGQPYTWPSGIPPYESLPLIAPAQLDAYFAALAEALPASRDERASVANERTLDPDQLTGRAADVRRAVEALPNTHDLFPTYQSYVTVAQAIKGALPDDHDLGLELFQEWAARYTGPAGETNDPDRVASDWSRCQPSHSLGAQYLYSLAQRHGGFAPADVWFTAGTGPEISLNAFLQQEAAAAETAPQLEPITWRDPADWEGVEPPEREWEVRDWIPRYEVTLLYGEGGVGKTLIAQQYATAAAAGKHWLGQPTRPARVMCLFCEDGDDELHRRQLDICRHYGITPAALRGRLRIASRKYMDNLLAIWTRNTGEMKRTAVWEQLRADAVEWRADVLIVDTVADTFGGSEIDRAQVNSFVKSCLGRLAQEIRGSVIALAHPSVGGRQEGRSGSTAWANASRARVYLRYPDKMETGNVRELVGTKANYSQKGSQILLRWERGAFSVIAASRAGTDPNAFKGDGIPTIEEAAERIVLDAWAALDNAELSIAKANAALYAPAAMRRARPEALAGYSDAAIMGAIDRMARAGRVIKGDKKRIWLAGEVGGVLD